LRRYGPVALALVVGVTVGVSLRRDLGGWLKARAHAPATLLTGMTGDGSSRLRSLASAGQSITVHNADQFQAAIARVSAGGTILMAPGDYSGLQIRDRSFDGVVNITSLDIARPAVIHDLTITKSAGLRFHDLEFSTAGAAVTAPGPTPDKRAEDTCYLNVRNSTRIEFDRMNFHGDPAGTLFTDVSALILQDCSHVTIANSEFQHFHNAVNHLKVDHLLIQNNRFHDLQDDSIRGGGSSYVEVIGNRFESMHKDPTDKDHPDCIQFWTTNTTQGAHDILVQDNIFTRGRGRPVQGIFFKDEAHVHYTAVVVKNNMIIGAVYNGISISGAVDIVISDNVVAQYPDQRSWLQLRDADGATLTHNRATYFSFVTSARVRESDDKVIDPVRDEGAALLRAWRPSFVGAGRAAADVGGRSTV
jgi:hypothetical protein